MTSFNKVSATIAGGLSIIALFSVINFGGCSNSTTTQVIEHDTVFVGGVDWDDSTWVSQHSGTNQTLVVTQFVDSTLGFAGGSGGTVLKTTDAGLSWSALSPSPNANATSGTVIYGLTFFNAQKGIVVGDGPDVYHTSDGGATWTATTIGTSQFMRSITFLNATTGFIGTSDPVSAGAAGEIWRTQDGGITWTKVNSNTTGGIYCIRFVDATHGVATGNFGTALWTSDGGATWQPATVDQSAQIARVVFTSATTAFAVTTNVNSGSILRSGDAGHSWHTVHSLDFAGGGIATNGSGVITANGYNGLVSESTDGGTTWNDYTQGNERWIDIAYPQMARAVMIGEQGQIATRHRLF